MGTERKIATLADLVPKFYTVMLGRSELHIAVRSRLFLLCIASPGWMHGWDIILQRGLRSLTWFHVFIVGFRSLVQFLRSKLWRGQLARHLKAIGFPIIAAVIDNIRTPSIAEWRWTAIAAACRASVSMIDTLTQYLRADIFGNRRTVNKTILTLVAALGNISFRVHLHMVAWFSNWITEVQSWGRGQKTDPSDASYDALWNGRRLPEAGPYVEAVLAQGLAECNTWTVDTFGHDGCSFECLLGFQAMVRGSFNLAQKRHAYLYKLPWLLARLLQPGVKALCTRQYLESENHHPISHVFFAGETKHDVDALDESGQGDSARLVRAVESIAAMPFDDSVAESPHSVGSGLARHARGSSFA